MQISISSSDGATKGKERNRRRERLREGYVGKEALGSSTDYTVPHSMMRDKERVRTWEMISHKADATARHYPRFWEDVQAVADQISRKGKGWQREEGYKGGYKGQDQGKGGYKGKDQGKGGYKGGCKGKNQNKGKDNPQNPFVASAQANQAEGGPPYFFRGWGPALKAAAPAAAAAAAAPVSADSRESDAQKGGQKGQKGQIPVTPQKKVGWQDHGVNRAANQQREWEEWGRDQGPRPLRPG